MDNHTETNPNGGDELLTPTAPQGSTDDSGQGGSAGDTPPELPKWQYQLLDDLKGHERIREHKSPNDTVRAYIDLADQTQRMVELPGDDADEGTKNAFFDRIRPSSPDDYTLPEATLPDGFALDQAAEKRFREYAHGLYLSNSQAAALFQREIAREAAGIQKVQQAEAAIAKEVAQLKTEWGDGFKRNEAEAKKAFNTIAAKLQEMKLAGADFGQRMVAKFGEDPVALRAFHGIYQMIKDDSITSGSVDSDAPAANDVAGFFPNTDFDS